MTGKKSQDTRRGRPPRSDEQVEASRKRIVDAARTLFAADGYEGVSMRKIATLANCQPSMLYTLFPNKRRLLHVLWEAIFVDLGAVLDRAYADSAPPKRLEAMCLAMVNFWLDRPEDYRAIFLVEDRLQDSDDGYFAQSPLVVSQVDGFRQAVAEAQARGEVRAGDRAEFTSVALCCVQGVAYSLIAVPEFPWGDPDRVKTLAIKVLMDGLR